jgi:cell division protein FtsB
VFFLFCQMALKSIQGDKVRRLEARIRVARGASRLAMMLFCLSIGFVVVATAVPQRREVLRLEKRLQNAMKQEAGISAERDHRQIELRALREDPGFLEVHARDRLDLCEEGERIFRFPRE